MKLMPSEPFKRRKWGVSGFSLLPGRDVDWAGWINELKKEVRYGDGA
jgi:hypothetical protein